MEESQNRSRAKQEGSVDGHKQALHTEWKQRKRETLVRLLTLEYSPDTSDDVVCQLWGITLHGHFRPALTEFNMNSTLNDNG